MHAVPFTCVTKMAATTSPLLMRILAASVSVSNRAAIIIRDIMKKGELGIIEKVSISNSSILWSIYSCVDISPNLNPCNTVFVFEYLSGHALNHAARHRTRTD